jgi:hypothetical protein
MLWPFVAGKSSDGRNGLEKCVSEHSSSRCDPFKGWKSSPDGLEKCASVSCVVALVESLCCP